MCSLEESISQTPTEHISVFSEDALGFGVYLFNAVFFFAAGFFGASTNSEARVLVFA